MGLVWDEGSIRTASQLLSASGTSNETSRSVPSAVTVWRAATRELTTSSTGTSREEPMRARSRCQYGAWSKRSRRRASFGIASSSAATFTVTRAGAPPARRTSLPPVPTSRPLTVKSIRWLRPSPT